MAYLSLYRRLRPLAFAQITGQGHVTRTLSHALSRGQLAHAYLFCGPRGTGKTTTAKILARAVNCHRYPAPEPCGECPPCRNIAAGVSLDVIEMDAASNRGIDEIRELRERTRYASGESRHKVYIIDEAHMLTNEACNAFLKTLEEPPPGVIFILATTDPSRLPSTIVSRCQRFDFHLLTVKQIAEKLQQVIADEGWNAEDEAVRLMARLAEGSLRDALGILEQCSAYDAEMLTAEHVRSLTGVTRVETIGALIEALAAGDLEAGLQTLQEIVYSGRDLTMLLRDLIFFFSRLLLGGTPGRLRLEESYYGFEDLLKQYRGRFHRDHLLELIELLHGLSGEMRYAHYPQFILEVAYIRMMRLLHREELPAGPPALSEKSGSPKRAVAVADSAARKAAPPPRSAAKGGAVAPPPPEPPATEPEEPADAPEPPPTAASPPAGEGAAVSQKPPPADFAADASWWGRLLNEVKGQRKVAYRNLNASRGHKIEGKMLILTYEAGDYAGERIMESNHRRLLEESCRKVFGQHLQIKVRYVESEPKGASAEEAFSPVSPSGPGDDGEAAQGKKGEDSYRFEEAERLFPGEVFEVQ